MRVGSKLVILGLGTMLVLSLDLLSLGFVEEAEAVAGTRRRTARRTAVVVESANTAENAQAQQQAAAAQQQAATAEQEKEAAEADASAAKAEADAAKQQAAAAEAAAATAVGAAGALPVGTVVTELPPGCKEAVIDGVQYSFDGTNYFRAAFQGSQLVYVTAKP